MMGHLWDVDLAILGIPVLVSLCFGKCIVAENALPIEGMFSLNDLIVSRLVFTGQETIAFGQPYF